MSFGNTNDQNNKAHNYPWQRAVIDLLKQISVSVAGGGGTNNTPYGPIRATIAGTVPIGSKGVSFYNAGGANASVNGGILKSGEQISFDGGVGMTIPIAYDGTGTELVIVYTL